MNLTDLNEFKVMAEIDPADTREDKKLLFFIKAATDWIEEYLNRPLFLKARTQYVNGTNTQSLLLNARPVYVTPTIQVIYGNNFLMGSNPTPQAETPLVYGTDFYLDIDDFDAQTSRSGILRRFNTLWLKPYARQSGFLSPFVVMDSGSYKVTYTGGFSVSTLSERVRQACSLLIAKMRYVFPLGMELAGEGYEERSISHLLDTQKTYMMSLVKPMLHSMRNWKFAGGN